MTAKSEQRRGALLMEASALALVHDGAVDAAAASCASTVGLDEPTTALALAALASCAAMDEQMFSLRAEVAALMQDKEEATFSLERLRSSSNSARSVDIQVRSGSHSKSEQSADNRSRESERVAALEARLKQADEHIHQLVTHGGTQ